VQTETEMDGEALKNSPVVIAEDDDAIRQLLVRLLQRDGYTNIHACESAGDVVSLTRDADAHIVLLDLHMPGASGFEVMEALRASIAPVDRPPILVLTGDHSSEARHRALASGASDFLTKPLDHSEVLLRVGNLLRMHALRRALQQQNERLEAMVRARTAELELTQLEILERLAYAGEHRDDVTGQHTRRVSELCGRLALQLGLGSEEADLIRRGSILHDVGKIGTPDAVLLKAGALTAEERALMQRHTAVGARILSGSAAPLLQIAERIALSHHERWDGTGYPHGLAGEEIPVAARIVAVADAYDALTNERPYKQAWTPAAALQEIAAESGRQFDPRIAAALIEMMSPDQAQTPPPS
jgi:putative two-component system response regulator